MVAAYIGDFFNRIPGIISQAYRNLFTEDLGTVLLSEPSCQSIVWCFECPRFDRQDDFYSLKKAVRSFYEAYSINISANESWDDRQAAVGYQLNKTFPSHERPRFVISGRQMDALQQRHFRWRAIARTLRVSYRTILRRRRELEMAVDVQFSRVTDAELDEIV